MSFISVKGCENCSIPEQHTKAILETGYMEFHPIAQQSRPPEKKKKKSQKLLQ